MQDFIFTAGSLVFIASLIPSIRSADKPALVTSLTTGLILFIFSITYLTFEDPLWFSAVATFVTSVCWFILAWQKWQQPDVSINLTPSAAATFSNGGYVTGDDPNT